MQGPDRCPRRSPPRRSRRRLQLRRRPNLPPPFHLAASPRHYPGLELVHEEPPVYVACGFLAAEDCDALRRAAEAGQLPRLEYDNVSRQREGVELCQ